MASFPSTRLRRIRSWDFLRRLTQEHQLSVADLVQPVFVHAGKQPEIAIATMPGVYRFSIDRLLQEVERLLALGVAAINLYPVLDAELKDEQASAALDADGLIPRTLDAIRQRFPEMGLMPDVALDPYTSHGQDGLLDQQGRIDNDKTIERFAQQALLYAQAGAQVVAPSDMMDGRTQAIRGILEKNHYHDVAILAYCAKYCSQFYGPFRDAVDSQAALGNSNKASYQLDCANRLSALEEVAIDIDEGADMIMVKPASHYLDIVLQVKQQFKKPVFVYQVSGEYAMIKAASAKGWLDEPAVVLESLLSMKRAGADGIFSYYAKFVAEMLSQA